ncbi:hypothetical protein M9Y10_028993 [Tritrichomonas musculus]|uniref:Uncharacterized protein n=1 Tax=Tritrichomonas musculus TaxID=1915356 RepID=A0ABR2KKU3_9EUKA
MSDILYTGRKLFLFTRPDGTYFVEKPHTCRRIFPETNDINANPTFLKQKTWNPSEKKWNQFKDHQEKEIMNEELQYDQIQDTIKNVDEILFPSNED